MESAKNLLESLLERGMSEAETDAAQSDVREHGIGLEVVGQNGTNHESGRHRGYSKDAQWTVRETGERSGELRQSDRIVVDEEVPAAGFAALREMHQRTGTVLDVNG